MAKPPPSPDAEPTPPPTLAEVPLPVWSSTDDGMVLSANGAAAELGVDPGCCWLDQVRQPDRIRRLMTGATLTTDVSWGLDPARVRRHRLVGHRSKGRWTFTATDVHDLGTIRPTPSVAELEVRFVRALEAARALVYEVSLDDDVVVGVIGLHGLLGPVPPPDGSREWWPSLVHPDDRHLLDERSRSGVPEGTLEYRVRHHDGRWLTVRNYHRLHTEGGRQRIVGTVVDVTAERAYRNALEQAHRQKDEFIALLGHELRNPLSAIRYAVTLQQRVKDAGERVVRTRDIIDRQSKHMARLVEGLLDVARVGRARLTLELAELDLVPLVRQVASDHEVRLDREGVTIEVVVPDHPVVVQGDAGRLLQVVDNLLTNAIKFTEEGTVQLRLEGGDRAVLTVTDTGVGIEPHLLERLFEPFRGLAGHPVHPRAGLGLGLALVKGIVELHGGEISARSEGLGRGTTFRVTLPVSTRPIGAVE